MPIQQPSERERQPLALDAFTVREGLIVVFQWNLECNKPEDHRVFN